MNAVILSICISIIGSDTHSDVIRDEVDIIEINHFHDEQGRLTFDQIIFYDWCDEKCRFQVRAWRLLKSQTQLPHRDLRGNGYITMWRDGDVTREVTAKQLKETWTMYDPEQAERKYLADTRRKELTKPKSITDTAPRRPRPVPVIMQSIP